MRNAEEQVLVQHFLPEAVPLQCGFLPIAGALFGIHGGDQVMPAQEAQELFQLLCPQGLASFCIGRPQHPLRVAERPVAQQTHGSTTEFEVAPAQRVGQRPLRRAVEPRRGWRQLQVRAQRRQHHSPRLWRAATSGRRNR